MPRRAAGAATLVASTLLPLATVAALALGACRSASRPSGGQAPAAGRITTITEEQIVRMGVRTAWDAVRLQAPYLLAGTDAAGQPTGVRIQQQRSINADETPLLVVDDVPMHDLQYLNELPASEVRIIYILSAEAAQPRYGLRAAGGAVVVQTKMGR